MNTLQKSGGAYGTTAPVGNPLNVTHAGGDCCGPATPARGVTRFVPAWLGGSRGMIVAAVAIVGAGLALGWPTVVALGVAPILLSVLPCAVMCALGLCMMGKGRQANPPQGFAFQAPPEDRTTALASAGEAALAPSPNAFGREPARLS